MDHRVSGQAMADESRGVFSALLSLSGFSAQLKGACMVIPALPPPPRDHNNLFGNAQPYPSCFPGWDPSPCSVAAEGVMDRNIGEVRGAMVKAPPHV